jgi:uncharacterized RDD family membrane protein YckC
MIASDPAELMTVALDTTLELETPEHIAFRYQLAGPARRAAAYLIDLLVRGAILLVVGIIIALTSSESTEALRGFEAGAMLLLFFALEWGYYVAFDLLNDGASPGKRAFQLRVVHQDGKPITLADSVLRNLLRAADLLPMFYALGVVSMMLDKKFRRLGDLVAQTVVVYEPVSKLSEGVSLEERNAIALFHRRLPHVSEARAIELADLIAPVFVERYGLGPVSSLDLLIALYERSARR